MFRNSMLKVLSVVGLFTLIVGCLEQYDPAPNNKIFYHEMEMAAQQPAKLSETGELPNPAQAVTIDVKYQQFCASCHGAAGGGDGPAGVALNPKPRAFTDKQWQASVNDDRIYTAIKSGGAAVGISPMMAPWGGVLSDAEIKDMVALVRSFGK